MWIRDNEDSGFVYLGNPGSSNKFLTSQSGVNSSDQNYNLGKLRTNMGVNLKNEVRQVKLLGGKDSWGVLGEGSGSFLSPNLTVHRHSMHQEMDWTQLWPLPVLLVRRSSWTRRGSGIK